MTSSQIPSPEQAIWTVDGLNIAGQVFGPDDGPSVLALHGWLDNSASFETLARALPQLRIIALDMPGHGLSDHRSPDSTYQIWDDVPQLLGVLEQLGGENHILVGHSRGGMIASLIAAVAPERVSALITLDAMLALPNDDADLITQFRSFLRDRKRQANKPVRVFESVDEYIERRTRAGEPASIAAQLAGRSLRKTGSGLEWRGDPRLSGASAIKLNTGQNKALLEALTMPVLNIWASPSARMQRLTDAARALAARHVADLTVADIPGHHHWHMEEETACKIAAEIMMFLEPKL